MDIRCYLQKNTTETAAQAPYTWRVIPNGVANLNDIVNGVLERISSSEERVRMALTEALKVALSHVLAGETVDLGGVRLKAQIPGSSPCEDSPFDPTTNEVVVCAYVDDELRDTFDGVVPVKVSAADVASAIKVSNVMDVATEAFGTVVGTKQFVILGNGITLDAADEYAKALDKKTLEVKGTATVQSVSKGQRAYCAFPAAIAPNDYTLEVATKGLIGEATPRVFRKPITILAQPEVRLTKASSWGGGDPVPGTVYGAEFIVIDGENLDYHAGDQVTITDTARSETKVFTGEAITSGTDTKLELDYSKATGGSEAGFNPGADCTLTIAYKGKTLTAQFKVARPE